VPTFVSTLCICIVWFAAAPTRAAFPGYLFLPLAEAVIFAMIASFILSRTLTPTPGGLAFARASRGATPAAVGQGSGRASSSGSNRGFEARFRNGFRVCLPAPRLRGLSGCRRQFAGLYSRLDGFAEHRT